MSFAESTSVPVERSRAEIERLLVRYGAERFGSVMDRHRCIVAFEMRIRAIRMTLPIPPRDSPEFWKDKRSTWGKKVPESKAAERFDQEVRRRWRALALVIKAKLEAVESGIVTFEEEWLAHFVLPGGKTVAETIAPELERAYSLNAPPRLLIGFSSDD